MDPATVPAIVAAVTNDSRHISYLIQRSLDVDMKKEYYAKLVTERLELHRILEGRTSADGKVPPLTEVCCTYQAPFYCSCSCNQGQSPGYSGIRNRRRYFRWRVNKDIIYIEYKRKQASQKNNTGNRVKCKRQFRRTRNKCAEVCSHGRYIR